MRGQLTTEARLRIVNTRLKKSNQKLRRDKETLQARVTFLEVLVEDLKFQITELQKIIFGKKHIKGANGLFFTSPSLPQVKKVRTKQSYRRPIPKKRDITREETKTINTCPDCGTQLIRKRILVRYVEDIKLPFLDPKTQLLQIPTRIVTKQNLEQGFCPKCQCWQTAQINPQAPLSPYQRVALGENVKKYVSYQTYLLRLSYQEIKESLLDLYGLKISDGEIANILADTSQKLNIPYQRLLSRIQKSRAKHLDETSWKTQGDHTFAWVMADSDTEEAVFKVGQSRGKGVAQELLGKRPSGTIITDCYSAYRNLPLKHQICWAHLLRKARDLAQSQALPLDKQQFSQEIYLKLQILYQELKEQLEKEKRPAPIAIIKQFKNKTQKISTLILSSTLAPKKLRDLGNLMLHYQEEMFVCLELPGIPPTNNKAEQKLRHLVLKRKNSFGTKTDKGSETFQINVSVLLSLWWNDRSHFWPRLHELMG